MRRGTLSAPPRRDRCRTGIWRRSGNVGVFESPLVDDRVQFSFTRRRRQQRWRRLPEAGLLGVGVAGMGARVVMRPVAAVWMAVVATVGAERVRMGMRQSTRIPAQNVQAAINRGGTVLLKAVNQTREPLAFEFGTSGGATLTTDVTIVGETIAGLKTRIHGGTGPFRGFVRGVRSAIRGIHFDSPRSEDVPLVFSSGFEFTDKATASFSCRGTHRHDPRRARAEGLNAPPGPRAAPSPLAEFRPRNPAVGLGRNGHNENIASTRAQLGVSTWLQPPSARSSGGRDELRLVPRRTVRFSTGGIVRFGPALTNGLTGSYRQGSTRRSTSRHARRIRSGRRGSRSGRALSCPNSWPPSSIATWRNRSIGAVSRHRACR